jgi:uncharacterized protein
MEGTEVTSLVRSESIADDAAAALARVRARLRALGVPGEVVLTGAASVPGTLTKGDVDLHLRVDPVDFAPAVALLRAAYPPASPDAWAETLAVFDVTETREAGLAVTPAGSEHDRRFVLAWSRLRAEPALLEEYNEIKRRSFGRPGYDDAKSGFFSRITAE